MTNYQVPDDPREAEKLDLELFVHTRSPADSALLLAMEAIDAASATRDYQDALRLGRRGAEDAAAALERIDYARWRGGTILDGLRRLERRAPPRGITTVWVDGPGPDCA